MDNPLIRERKDRVFIVYGPPGSGKTTWVKEQRREGDLVVDLDYILAALALGEVSTENRDVLSTGLAVKDFLVEAIADGRVGYNRAFIITTSQLEKIQKLTGGTVIEMDVDPREIIRRIKNDKNIPENNKRRRIEIVLAFYDRKQRRQRRG